MREYVGGQPQQADGGAAAQSLDLRTANLTQELSQLLAQTLAQAQAGKAPATAAAGTQFTNLVALVSTATQTQRAHQPSFRDGLSSLAYTRPVQPVMPPPPPPPPPPSLIPPAPSLVSAPPAGFASPASGFMAPLSSSNGLLVSEMHDEEPMPIPSTWRQPVQGDDDKWYRQQLGAAGLGLLAGLVVVVPAVLWLSGFLGGGSQAKTARETPGYKVADVKPVKVASATVEPRVIVTPPPVAAVEPEAPTSRSVVAEPPPVVAMVPTPKPAMTRVDELLLQAKRRIESGDIAGARDILQGPDLGSSAAMTFLLAETYDPNMLASWQTRGVTANPERARALYTKARDLGEPKAQQRLDWLTAN